MTEEHYRELHDWKQIGEVSTGNGTLAIVARHRGRYAGIEMPRAATFEMSRAVRRAPARCRSRSLGVLLVLVLGGLFLGVSRCLLPSSMLSASRRSRQRPKESVDWLWGPFCASSSDPSSSFGEFFDFVLLDVVACVMYDASRAISGDGSPS